ncbi:transposase [Streptomyces sp. NBC_01614]|uniref:transposase n=1 Tax=Streptomyces sp. NBC_01614 TaxID=2975897 RepID=UPI003865D604
MRCGPGIGVLWSDRCCVSYLEAGSWWRWRAGRKRPLVRLGRVCAGRVGDDRRAPLAAGQAREASLDAVGKLCPRGALATGRGPGPVGAGVLVVDETGFAKRGNASAGVARRYCGALVEFSLARRGGAGRLGERHRPGSDRPGAVPAPRVDKGP